MRGCLAACAAEGATVVPGECWEMIGDGLPSGPLPLTAIITTGARDDHARAFYDKTLIFQPRTQLRYNAGCHSFGGIDIKPARTAVRLLPYKWLSAEYVAAKSRNTILSEANIRSGWGFTPDGKPSMASWNSRYAMLAAMARPLEFL